jgi:FKBP-type peptidyl-prolyl cis-trans isomerase
MAALRSRIPVVLAVVVALLSSACGGGTDTPSSPSSPSVAYSQTDLRVGTGAEATAGRQATVHYTLWLYDAARPEGKGTRIESSRDPGGSPLLVRLGSGGVIPGFERGVTGMRVGGERRVTIPPDLAYGSRGSGTAIPPNATLLFEIELLDVQ